jgi:hypothetical protein
MPPLKKTIKSALRELSAAKHGPLPFLLERCPICNGQNIRQSATGTECLLQHFSCPRCGFWVIIEQDEIRRAILDSAHYPEGAGALGSHGRAWFNAETGKLILFARDRDRRRLVQEWRDRQRLRAEGAV